MTQSPSPSVVTEADDVHVLSLGEKTFFLIGTAHISQESADLVEQVIRETQPDCVCVELDAKRYAALSQPEKWKNFDLKQVIRQKQLSTLLVNLILSSYQKRLGGQLGVMPGTELLMAVKTAEELGIPVELCDRDIRVTLRRAWKATSFYKKSYLLASLMASLFDTEEIDEEKLTELRKKDVLSELMGELGTMLPDTKRVLIDERDIYMAEKIKAAPGKRIVAVLGAGHMEGLKRALERDHADDMAAIDTIPPVSPLWKIAGWGIPAVIICSIILIAFQQGIHEAGLNTVYWILANGIPASIGAGLAWAHPMTVLSAFAAAPITSLTPVIGAGYVAAFFQVLYKPPLVQEFECAGSDISTVVGWWQNKLLRVLLVFLLTGFGSMVGTWVGGYKIMSSLFH